MNWLQQSDWPFNPNFQQAFSFPAFGTVEWLALARWHDCKGDVSKIRDVDRIKAGVKLDWKAIWFNIYQRNFNAARCRFLNRITFANAKAARSFGVEGWTGTPSQRSVISFPDTKHYRLPKPGEWVETLLDADAFWLCDINAWACECVEKEFRILNPKGAHLSTYAMGADPDGAKAKKCEDFCRRFHAYQQARYRWHEHLLDKHCERALGAHAPRTRKIEPAGYISRTAKEARAGLIGWLSKQRGYAENPLVKEFRRMVRATKSTLSLGEKKAFWAEHDYPSGHRYRTVDAPLRPDEEGWLILTWPIWNFHDWKWAHIGEALIKKFQFGDRDFLLASRKRLQRALRENLDTNGSMPAERALALFAKYLFNPTPKEKEMHGNWELEVKSKRGEKAIEKLARLAIGSELAKQIGPRPMGRGTDDKPPLWDFAQQIAA